jgi:hypothetical protein
VLAVPLKHLNEGNPHALSQAVASWTQQEPARLLAQVAHELLKREQTQKTVENLSTLFKGTAVQWENIYAPDEQCLRLLALECRHNLAERPPSDLPSHLRNAYEQAIRPWIEDHPFRGQQVFREYTYAWLLRREHPESDLRQSVRNWLTSTQSGYLPSRLLAEFLLAMGDGARIEAADLGFYYESVVAGCAKDETVRLSLASGDEVGAIAGELAWFNGGNGDAAKKPNRKLELSLQRPSMGVWFWRQLARADIQIHSGVVVGSSGADFVLGPDVDIESDKFACAARGLRVVADREERTVVATASQYDGSNNPDLVGPHADRKFFGVDWEPMLHPWAPYRVERERETSFTPEMRDAFQKLRRILVRFRAERYESIARSADLIENPMVAGKGPARAMLEYCVTKNLIRKAQGMYELDRKAMDSLGINWHEIRMGNGSQSIASFLASFVEANGKTGRGG